MQKWFWVLSLACLAVLPGCSKKQPGGVDAERTEIAANAAVQNGAEVGKTDVAESGNADAYVKRDGAEAKPEPALPVPVEARLPEAHAVSCDVTAEALKNMAPETAEAALLKGFSKNSDAHAEKLQVLKNEAMIGDDRAKEAFVVAMLEKSQTHADYPVALRYLKEMKTFTHPEAMMQRGLMEWQGAMGKPEGVEKAKVFFKQAAEANHQKTLEFLLRNGIFGMRAEAFKRLNQIYEQKAASRDPQVLYEWARMMEFAPPEMQKVADALIQESANAGYGPAMHTWAITLMAREGNWNEGYALLKKAALAGCTEASLQLATLYTIAHYADTLEMAHEMGGSSLTEAQFMELRNELAATGDPKMHIVKHAISAGGYDEACTLLLAVAANEDTAPSTLVARDAAIDCIDRFVAAQPTRDACDRAYDQLTYAEHQDFDFTHVFSDAQRELMGRIVLKCYHLALERGENYPMEQPQVGFATALQVAVLYAGNHAVKIAPDEMRQLQYIMYAAVHHHDVQAQVMLAQHYESGKLMVQNAERACHWYGTAASSEVCRVFCKQAEAAEMPVCQACIEAISASQKCDKASQP